MTEAPDPTPPADPGKEDDGTTPKTFTQAEVDEIVKERVKRERTKFADYDDLKKQAEGKVTAEERIAALEKDLSDTRTEALRRRIQAKHKITDEDADLFLTATDEDQLEAQAKRLAERVAEAEQTEQGRRKKGNKVPDEGANPTPGDDEMRTFTRNLFKKTG